MSPNLRFSAPPLRSLRLRGERTEPNIHRRDAKAAEITQRKTEIVALLVLPYFFLFTFYLIPFASTIAAVRAALIASLYSPAFAERRIRLTSLIMRRLSRE